MLPEFINNCAWLCFKPSGKVRLGFDLLAWVLLGATIDKTYSMNHGILLCFFVKNGRKIYNFSTGSIF